MDWLETTTNCRDNQNSSKGFKAAIVIILKDLKKNMNTIRQEKDILKNLSVTFKNWKTVSGWT